jgi:hypothetical protein
MIFVTVALISGFALPSASYYPAGTQDDDAQGIETAEVFTIAATVEKIDVDKRKATLLLDDGKKKTVKVDKSIPNLNRVKPGDHVNITYAEDIIIVVGHSNESPGASGGGLVSIAPKGAKPGQFVVGTSSLSAKVVSVDAEKHRVVLEDPDGKNRTVKLGKKVTNLDELKPGETIEMTITDALAIDVTK